jgi:predicted cupin superfamily sugar epimerase
MTADQIIAHLALTPHPEGGYYRQTWVADNAGRPSGTCIYFLLKAGQATDHLLTPDLTKGAPQLIVPENHWQAARTTGDYTLVSCTVSPGFQFEGFTLAPKGMDIPR